MCSKNCLLDSIVHLRDVALMKYERYKYDPHLSRAHDEYLSMLNTILIHDQETEYQQRAG